MYALKLAVLNFMNMGSFPWRQLNLQQQTVDKNNKPTHRRTGTIFWGGAKVILPECDVTKNDVISRNER